MKFDIGPIPIPTVMRICEGFLKDIYIIIILFLIYLLLIEALVAGKEPRGSKASAWYDS